MRLGRPVAWLIVVSALFTAGLLRQFHDSTPRSPYIHPVAGSLLFFAVLLVLLVYAWELRRGAVGGRGVRLGSLCPLLFILFLEKWASTTLYGPIFHFAAPADADPARLDAAFIVMAGGFLLVLCVLLSRAFEFVGIRLRGYAAAARLAPALLGAGAVIAFAYALLWLLAVALGGQLDLRVAELNATTRWIVAGQGLLAVGEEVYYRGLVLIELLRLAPRLGLSSPALRRWLALLGSAAVFAMEHLRIESVGADMLRQLVFTASLGLLLGILVLVTRNIYFAALIHAWINWLLLGAAPRFTGGDGEPLVAAGVYIGVVLIVAFVVAFVFGRRRDGDALRDPKTA